MPRGVMENMEPRECLVCHEFYKPNRIKQFFCPTPKKCSQSWAARKIMESRKSNLPQKCANRYCDIEFTPTRTGQVTCSSDCPNKNITVPRKCAHALCKKDFEVSSSNNSGWKQRFCSIQCRRKEEIIGRYNISSEVYKEIIEHQNYKCAICRTDLIGKNSHIDHNHNCPNGCTKGGSSCGLCVRGILCVNCNKALGNFIHKLSIINNAITYLSRDYLILDTTPSLLKDRNIFVCQYSYCTVDTGHIIPPFVKKRYCTDSCQEKDYRIKRYYNISSSEHLRILLYQNNKCGICQIDMNNDPSMKGVMCLDHDHNCCPTEVSCGSCIRGILCKNCNTGIEQVNGDILILEAIINYLS